MSPTPLISVIIPVYNTEKYLCKCVDSVLAQTYQNLEIILVDDGSADSCGRLCDEYASKDPRVQVIHQQNAGLSAARNAGIKAAKGEYFSFIDSDDWVDARFIETLWNLANGHRAPVCVVGRYTVFPTHTRREKMLPKGKNIEIIEAKKDYFDARQALQLVFADYGYFLTNKLFRADLFKEVLFPQGLMYEDIWIQYRLFRRVNKIAVCDTPLFYYNRQNENSVSRGRFHIRMLDYFTVTDEFLDKAKELEDSHLLRTIERQRLAHICGFFKRMMLSGFNDQNVIQPMQQELRRHLWILLLSPRPLSVTAFGMCCCVSFQLTKKLFLAMVRAHLYAPV